MMKNVKVEPETLIIELESGFSGNYSKQIFPHLDSRAIQYDNEGNLLVSQLLKPIYPQDSKGNFMISYFSSSKKCYVYLATYPVDPLIYIPRQEIDSGKLQLKFRYISSAELLQPTVEDDVSDEGDKVGRRTKERKIGYIIEKVAR